MKDFICISKYAGMREDLVQAGGGNSSVKLTGTKMAIKSSGVQLADVSDNYGYSVVDYPMIKRFMDDLLEGKNNKSAEQVLKDSLIEGTRPSIETFLHAVTGRITLHTHPVAVNVLASRKNGMERLKGLFPDAVIVEYATPGVELAAKYYSACREIIKKRDTMSACLIIFLKNHGVVVSGSTASEVIETTERISSVIENEVGLDNKPYRDAYMIYKAFKELNPDESKIIVKAENYEVLDAYRKLGCIWDYQFCPDCVVFCGRKPFVYSDGCGDKLRDHICRYGEPVLILHEGHLFIRAESVRKAREIESVLAFSARVALANRDFHMDLLSEQEQSFLLGWDAEKYRQSIK